MRLTRNALLDGTPRELDLVGLHRELVGDVEIALFALEMRRVVGGGVGDVVFDGCDLRTLEEARALVRGLDEVLRPVDAHVFALVPGAIAVVLHDDVRLLAGLRVVVTANVEVLVDLERGDDGAGGRVRRVLVGRTCDVGRRRATVVGAG